MADNGFYLNASKKNADVMEHLEELKGNKVAITDYVCNCIRFYIENKDNNSSSNNTKSFTIDEMKELKEIFSPAQPVININQGQGIESSIKRKSFIDEAIEGFEEEIEEERTDEKDVDIDIDLTGM